MFAKRYLYQALFTDGELFLYFMCVFEKGFLFHYVAVDRSYKTGVCLWLIVEGKSFLGLARY